MEVIGIGVDIVECARIGKMIERHGEFFMARVYTPAEIEYCQSHKGATERFAGRWAAKEAILKALGTGWRHGIGWLDMEVRNELSGRPMVSLSGGALHQAQRLGIETMFISISHARSHAIAYAMATGGAGADASGFQVPPGDPRVGP